MFWCVSQCVNCMRRPCTCEHSSGRGQRRGAMVPDGLVSALPPFPWRCLGGGGENESRWDNVSRLSPYCPVRGCVCVCVYVCVCVCLPQSGAAVQWYLR